MLLDDDSRVKLKPLESVEGSDYINASFVDVSLQLHPAGVSPMYLFLFHIRATAICSTLLHKDLWQTQLETSGG